MAKFSIEVLGFKNAPHHNEWYNILGNENLRRIVFAAPRGHAKSTVASVNYVCWEIAKNPNVRILIVSHSESQSKSFLREVVGHLERDEEYIEFAGVLKPKYPEKWTTQEIIVNRDDLKQKDPTISTVGAGGTILSRRADIIICDDILNPQNTSTPEQRDKVRQWFYDVLLPVLTPTGRLIVVGTVFHPQDLLTELLTDPTFDYHKKFRAINHDADRMDLWQKWCNMLTREDGTGKPEAQEFLRLNRREMYKGVDILWPEKFTYEFLYMLRYANSYSFARMYQNDPADRADQKFKEAWIEDALRKGSKLRLQDTPQFDYLDLTTQGLDLAISQENSADDTCLFTLDRIKYDVDDDIKQGMYVVRQIKRGHWTPKETRDTVERDYYVTMPVGIRVESVAYQEAMLRDLEDKSLPVRGHRTGSEKWDSALGVNSLAILAEQGRLILPNDKTDARTRELVGKLTSEMRSFPDGHTGDSLMAFWFAYLEMQDLTATRFIFPKSSTGLVDPPRGEEARKAGEKEADKQVISEVEQIRRKRADYWKEETKKLLR